MARNSLFDAPRVALLQDVLMSIHAGDMLFPEFQRSFVWSDDQRLQLFDSVLKGLPIGSLLVWRTSESIDVKSRVGPVTLPRPVLKEEGGLHNHVLDGLQRLTTLYAALIGGVGSDEEYTEASRGPAQVFIDLSGDEGDGDLDAGDYKRFKLSRVQRSVMWLPLQLLFDDDRLWDFQEALFSLGHRIEGNRAKHVARRFARFEIPLVPIVTSDLDLVTQTFERVNTQGTQMNEAHMLRTLLYTSSLGLDKRLDTVIEECAWPDLPRKLLVNTVKVLLGQNVYRSNMRAIADAIRGEQHSGEPVLDRLHRGMTLAVDFLRRRCGIYSFDVLPYAYQLVGLVRVFVEAESIDEDALSRWFWVTTYAEYFTGQTNSQLRRSFDDVMRVAEGRSPTVLTSIAGDDFSPLSRRDRPDPLNWPPGPIETYRAGSVRSTAWLHRMAWYALVGLDGHPLHGPTLLGRGAEVAVELYQAFDGRRPENRILAAPETARELREALFDPSHPHVAALRGGHVLPPLDHPASKSPAGVLEWRRNRLQAGEQAFVQGLG